MNLVVFINRENILKNFEQRNITNADLEETGNNFKVVALAHDQTILLAHEGLQNPTND